jgi:hypothetical protein
MREPGEQSGPLTGFERGFFALLLTIILGLFVADVIRDYEPGKLAALFFIAFTPPLVVLHEAGHALMAVLLGWHVRRIVIGVNRPVGRWRIGGVPVTLKLIPLSGYVVPIPGDLKAPRLKLALIYLAGPGIELLLLGLLILYFGPQTFLSRSEDVGVLALQGLAIAILFSAFSNLVPIPHVSGGRMAVSDGLGIIRSFTRSDDDFRSMMFSQEEEDPEEEWWKRGEEGWASDRDPESWR